MHYKRLYHVFLLGAFLLHYYAQSSLIYFLLQWMAAHQMTWYGYFFIVFIPSAITAFVFYITQEKASSYYSRYLLLALLMPPFLIPILATLFDLIYFISWHDAIDMLVEYYLTHGILACILGVVQLVLAAICLP